MVVIKGYWEPILKIVCSCCQDFHYAEVERWKHFLDDSEKLAYYIQFKYESYMTFKDRLSQFFDIRKTWKTKQRWEDLLIEYDQLGDFYNTLLNDAIANSILDDADIAYINAYNKPKMEESVEKGLNTKMLNEWHTVSMFQSKDDFVFGFFYVEATNGRPVDVFLGWDIRKLDWKEINKATWNYLFTRKRKNYIQEFDCCLYKEDVVQLLASIKYFMDKMVKIPEQGAFKGEPFLKTSP
jgi:hypothetical protein